MYICMYFYVRTYVRTYVCLSVYLSVCRYVCLFRTLAGHKLASMRLAMPIGCLRNHAQKMEARASKQASPPPQPKGKQKTSIEKHKIQAITKDSHDLTESF